MRILFLFFLTVLFLVSNDVSCDDNLSPVHACLLSVLSNNYAACANQLASSIYRMHNWSKRRGDVSCGFPCTHKLKGRFSKWEWKWDAEFRCDSKAPGIVGQATKYSKDGAKEWAIKDFVDKAIAAGHIKGEDVKC